MDLLSSPLIGYITAALGVALILFKNPSIRLCGAWFIAEALCLSFTVGMNNDTANAQEMLTYRLLYASSAVLFTRHITKTKGIYSDNMSLIFRLIAFLSLISGWYHWFTQSRWEQWGKGFEAQYGDFVTASYFFAILGLEALLIILGVSSVLAANSNHDPNERKGTKRR